MAEEYLSALECLKLAHAIDPENPILHEQTIRFRQAGKKQFRLLLVLDR
jgi:hypothetical protein